MQNRFEITFNASQSEILLSPARFLALVCGRRYGKTTVAEGDIKKVASKPNQEILYVATTYMQAKRIMLNRLLSGIPKWWLRKQPTISQMMEFNLINGSNIYLAGGRNYEVFRGMEFDKIYIDETADQSETMWREVLRPAIADREGSAMFLGTPKGKNNWFYDLTLSQDVVTFHRTSADGGRISQNELLILKNEMDERTYSQEIMAEFIVYTGSVYHSWNKNCLSDLEFNSGANTYISFDFNVDPMTAVVFQEQSAGYFTAVKEFYLGNSNTYDICNEINKYLDFNVFSGILNITGDNAGTYRSSNSPLTNYKIIDSILGKWRGYNKRLKRTDRIVNRINCTNHNLRNGKIKVNAKTCPNLANELGFLEYKKTGDIDSRGGTVGHITDAFSYFAFNYTPLTADKILSVK